jgi:hypothetical protein
LAKKVMGVEVHTGSRRIGSHTIRRLVVYYLVAGAILLVLTGLFPQKPVDTGMPAPTGMSEALEWLRAHITLMPGGAPTWADASVQMVGALLLVLPIAFTYIRTRTRVKYDHSLIQTVVMLPIVVTAILVVVQDSLALAFSLAGIVAAVRFRNNLKESGDAVYIFGSIGIGFATGIHALAVAMALSVFFVVLELVLWKLNLGAEFDDTFNRLCMPSGSDRAAPPPSAGDVPDAGAGNGRKHTPEELATDPRVATLKIFVDDVTVGRASAEQVLARDAKVWIAGVTEPGEGKGGVLEYRVRPRKSVGLGGLRDNLLRDGAPHVIATDEAAPAGRV